MKKLIEGFIVTNVDELSYLKEMNSSEPSLTTNLLEASIFANKDEATFWASSVTDYCLDIMRSDEVDDYLTYQKRALAEIANVRHVREVKISIEIMECKND